jgi:hypothetical protein
MAFLLQAIVLAGVGLLDTTWWRCTPIPPEQWMVGVRLELGRQKAELLGRNVYGLHRSSRRLHRENIKTASSKVWRARCRCTYLIVSSWIPRNAWILYPSLGDGCRWRKDAVSLTVEGASRDASETLIPWQERVSLEIPRAFLSPPHIHTTLPSQQTARPIDTRTFAGGRYEKS